MDYAINTYSALTRRLRQQQLDADDGHTDDGHPAATGQSQLLLLPTELRLKICSYMTIVPADIDWKWKGAFFSCTQLHKDMLDQLSPAQDMERFLKTKVKLPQPREGRYRITPGLPHPFFGWVRSLTVHIPLSEDWSEVMQQLYPLYLDELKVQLINKEGMRPRIELPWGDLKSTVPPLLTTKEPRRVELAVNCKKITVTLYPLNRVEGARSKVTSFDVTLPDTDITFLFTIVETSEAQQVERSYTFKNRFRLRVEKKGSPRSTGLVSLHGLLGRFW
jgi:hypothetical protein